MYRMYGHTTSAAQIGIHWFIESVYNFTQFTFYDFEHIFLVRSIIEIHKTTIYLDSIGSPNVTFSSIDIVY